MCDMFDFLQDNDELNNGDMDQIGFNDDYQMGDVPDDNSSGFDDSEQSDALDDLVISSDDLDHLDELDEPIQVEDMHEGQVSFCGDTISCSDCSGSCSAYCASMNSQA